jgi:hypothetical protein
MIEIFVFVIMAGMFFLDHRLSKLVKIQREILLATQRGNDVRAEIAKALQWMVNNWLHREKHQRSVERQDESSQNPAGP